MSQNFPIDQRVVHVSGPCACGKSALANTIRNEFTPEEVSVLDVDDFITEETEDGKKLSKIDNSNEYTKEYIVVLKRAVVEFLQKNRRTKLIVLIGFLDFYTIQNAEFANYICAFAHERFYIHVEFTALVDRFFSRVKRLTQQHKWLKDEMKQRNIDLMKTEEIMQYEVELSMLHSFYEFIRMDYSKIHDRIRFLSSKHDKTKTMLFVYKNKSTGSFDRIALAFSQVDGLSDEIIVEKEISAKKSLTKRNLYFPTAQAEKIWIMAYRMNKEGLFNYKSQPLNCECVRYDGNYGNGADLSPLLKLFLSCVE